MKKEFIAKAEVQIPKKHILMGSVQWTTATGQHINPRLCPALPTHCSIIVLLLLRNERRETEQRRIMGGLAGHQREQSLWMISLERGQKEQKSSMGSEITADCILLQN